MSRQLAAGASDVLASEDAVRRSLIGVRDGAISHVMRCAALALMLLLAACATPGGAGSSPYHAPTAADIGQAGGGGGGGGGM